MYSHKSFRASLPLRIVLAALGTAAHQGSIRWWCLRHRLHHRFTDDPIHDPYAATRGLFYSHVGWIFYKPNYGKLGFIETDDLDNDPVVRIQHRYYHLLALFFGFCLPAMAGYLWGDTLGGFIWGGLVARIFVWHCTFFVNSLAHWNGLQPYSDDNTSRGNLILALLTCGEGNHNFHVSLRGFNSIRSTILHPPSTHFPMTSARSLRRAKDEDIKDGLEHMRMKDQGKLLVEEERDIPIWTHSDLINSAAKDRCLILLDGYIIDATKYLSEHPGGSKLMRSYSLRSVIMRNAESDTWPDASLAFHGGMNIHSWAANQQMKRLRVAKLRN
ncbi:hypothetical protein NP233_g4868 [Leucocoprinus birnbaumii]|uniref:Cytochrome b5 heme-binding domain-containing protein n=1 Tax=Leucocoprinus birnbaumii TaxID=56174 RepID=A0AAD5VXK7_9AGAR|nr:hypothetical protein NP233_g4868 [Leucocoprinus birnbaumii]